MAKISKTVVDADLRNAIFNALAMDEWDFVKINDRQYGIILTDKNGVERYCRVGVIVAEEREDMTARELMQAEIDAYNVKFLITSVFVTCLMECPKCKIQFKQEYWYQRKEKEGRRRGVIPFLLLDVKHLKSYLDF